MKTSKQYNFYIFVGVCILGLCTLMVVSLKQQKDILSVSFLNVGQGDAIFIEAPNGVQVLVDAGPDSKVIRELAKVMPFWDRTIDIIIPTHADKDHIGGFPEILKRFSVKHVYDMKSDSTTEIFEAYEMYKDQEHAFMREAQGGDTIILDKNQGVYLRVLFPEGNSEILERNDTSTVVQLIYKDIQFLLTGDAGKMVEEYLLHNYEHFLTSNVLKAGHHGSNTSTSPSFLQVINPEYVVISAGEDNNYGHPHQEVVDMILNQGATMVETKNGTIQFFTDGQQLFLK